MKKFFTHYLLIAVVIVLVALGVYLINSSGRSSSLPVKVGVILPLSSFGAPIGENVRNAITLALEEQKMSDQVQSLFEDSQGVQAQAVTAAKKLIEFDKVTAILGPLTASEILAVAPLAEESKTILLTFTSPHPKITDAGKYIFRTYPSDDARGKILARYALKNTPPEAIMGILYKNDEFGNSLKDIFVKEVQTESDREIMSEAYPVVPGGQTDFRTNLLKLKSKNVQLLFMVGHYKELGFIVKQAHEMAFTPQFLTTADFEHPDVLKIAGDAAEGVVYGALSFGIDNSDAKTQTFVKTFTEKFNKKPDLFAGLAYDATNVLLKALKETKQNQNNLFTSLESVAYSGLSGEISFDENGDVHLPWTLKTVRNGQFVGLSE